MEIYRLNIVDGKKVKEICLSGDEIHLCNFCDINTFRKCSKVKLLDRKLCITNYPFIKTGYQTVVVFNDEELQKNSGMISKIRYKYEKFTVLECDNYIQGEKQLEKKRLFGPNIKL